MVNIGKCNVLEAELGCSSWSEACLEQWVQESEGGTDSAQAIKWLKTPVVPNLTCKNSLLKIQEQIQLCHILREANRAPDYIATTAATSTSGFHPLHLPPVGLHRIVREDALPFPIPRLVRDGTHPTLSLVPFRVAPKTIYSNTLIGW